MDVNSLIISVQTNQLVLVVSTSQTYDLRPFRHFDSKSLWLEPLLRDLFLFSSEEIHLLNLLKNLLYVLEHSQIIADLIFVPQIGLED